MSNNTSGAVKDVLNLAAPKNDLLKKIAVYKPSATTKNNKTSPDLNSGQSIELQANPVLQRNTKPKLVSLPANASQNTAKMYGSIFDKRKLQKGEITEKKNILKNGTGEKKTGILFPAVPTAESPLERVKAFNSNVTSRNLNLFNKNRNIYDKKKYYFDAFENYMANTDDGEFKTYINQMATDLSYNDLWSIEEELKDAWNNYLGSCRLGLPVTYKTQSGEPIVYNGMSESEFLCMYYATTEAKKISGTKNTEDDWAAIRANEIFRELNVGDLNESYLTDTALEQLVERKTAADENYQRALNGTLDGLAGDGTAPDADEKIIRDAKIEAKALEYALLLYTNYLAENYTLSYLYQMHNNAESKLAADSIEHPGNLTEVYDVEQLQNQKSLPVVMSILKEAFYLRKETHPDDKIYNELQYIMKHFGQSIDTIKTNFSNTGDYIWGVLSDTSDESHERIIDRTNALRANAQAIESRAPLTRGLGAMRMVGRLPEQAPQVALTMVQPWLGLAYTGVNAFGSAYGDAAVSGAGISESATYAFLNAGVEIALEKLMGSKVFGGESILGKKATAFINKAVASPAARYVIGYLGECVGEGVEDVISTLITPYLQKISNVPVDSPTFDDCVNSFVNGMFNSVFYGGISEIGKVYSNNGVSANTTTDTIGKVIDKTEIEPLTRGSEISGQPINATDVTSNNIIPQNSNIFNEDYDVDLAIGRIIDGKATTADFKLFEPGNTANRQALYDATGIELPQDLKHTNYSLLALNSKNKMHTAKSLTLDEYLKYAEQKEDVSIELTDNIPSNLAETVKAVKVRSGIDIVFGNRYVDGNLDTNFRGLFDGKKIIVSENATKADVFNAVVLHELTHGTEGTKKYNAIFDYVVKEIYGDDTARLDADAEAKIAEYKKNGIELTSEKAKSEIVAENVGKYIFADDASSIVGKNYTLGQKIYDVITELIYNIKKKFGNTFELDELASAQRKYRMALDEVKRKGIKSDGGYSIETIPGTNKKYVKFGRNLELGKTKEEWSKNIEKYIKDNITKNGSITIVAEDGDSIVINGRTAWKIADVQKTKDGVKVPMSDSELNVKYEAGAHIDELVGISKRGRKNKPDDGSHKWADEWNYRTAFFEDSKGDKYRLGISVGINDSESNAYNIGDIIKRGNLRNGPSSAMRDGGALNGDDTSQKKVYHDKSQLSSESKTEMQLAFEKAFAKSNGNEQYSFASQNDIDSAVADFEAHYAVDLAIGRIIEGKATTADFKLFEPGNTANRQALYEATGIELPQDLKHTNYNLLALNSKNKNILDLYLNKKTSNPDTLTLPDYLKQVENSNVKDIYLEHENTLKQPDSLTENSESGKMNKRAFLTEDDPMREVFGSAFDSNEQEVQKILYDIESKGVKVIYRDNVMAYQPSPMSGKPGQIVIDKKASYSAFKHEERHMLDDEASGWLGFRNFMDKDTAVRFETNAYDVEIELAKANKLYDMVERLEKLKEKRKRDLLDE